MPVMRYLTWNEFDNAVEHLASQLEKYKFNSVIYAQPRGGLCLAVALSHATGIPLVTDKMGVIRRIIWVDDIVDSGRTLRHAKQFTPKSTVYVAWYTKGHEPCDYFYSAVKDDWIVFPWEAKDKAKEDKDEYDLRD